MKKIRLLSAAVGSFSVLSALAQSPPSIVGHWTWTRAKNGCTETYEYRAGGKLFVVSGTEKTENEYSISLVPNQGGFFAMTITTTKEESGVDCSNSHAGSMGKTSTAYVKFSPSGDQHIVCYDSEGKRCYGPLARVPKSAAQPGR